MKVTVLCIATNGYDEKWKPCIESQRNYCEKWGFSYFLITEFNEEVHSKWFKLFKVQELLKENDVVILLDCDIYILEKSPNILEQLTPAKSVYIANGISGRPNSGVMIFENDDFANKFLEDVLADRNRPVSKDHFVTDEGENGHIIKWCKVHSEIVRTLSRKWNNTLRHIFFIFPRPHYFRHYTNKMKKYYLRDFKTSFTK